MPEVLQFPVKSPRVPTVRGRSVLQFPRPRNLPSEELGDSKDVTPGSEALVPKYIHGKLVRSNLEYMVYGLLQQAGWDDRDIQYQVGFLGGRNFRGGTVADFVLPTQPTPTIVFVNGDYWHSGEQTERDRVLRWKLQSELGYQYRIVELWGHELVNEELAFHAILEKVGYR